MPHQHELVVGVTTRCVHIQIASGHTIPKWQLLVSQRLATEFYLLHSDTNSISTCQFVINFYYNKDVLDSRKSVLYLAIYLVVLCYSHFKLYVL